MKKVEEKVNPVVQEKLSRAITLAVRMEGVFKLYSFRCISLDDFIAIVETEVSEFTKPIIGNAGGVIE